MSKIGKKPIKISEGVEVKLSDGFLEFKGKEGSLRLKILDFVSAEIKDGQLFFSVSNSKIKQARANWGTMASLAKNSVLGVSEGFSKKLEIEGIGFKANIDAGILVLNVGFTHPVKFKPPENIKMSIEKNVIKISGADKALVGETAATIRKIKKPEPYKGTGIRYQGEVIRRKAGKKAAGTTTA